MSNTKPRAVITGITGQDGAYLAALLLAKGYEVFGTYRRTSSVSFWRLSDLEIKGHDNLNLVESDVTDLSSAIRLIQQAEPSEVYNLAAQSFVGASFEQPITTADITGLGALNMLEAVRIVNPLIRFYQASTSEMFGKVTEVPQTERTPFYPRSPYGTAKLLAHWSTVNYREAFGIFASSGILFNHESPLRGIEFVTRKITDGLSKVHLGYEKQLELGNLDAKRDWGYAPEYVEGMWKMLQHTRADTFVLATGITKTVREFVTIAGRVLGMNISFEGEGSSEIGIDVSSGKTIVKVNPMFYRPAEVDLLVGNASKASQELDWQPVTSLESLCESMVSSDLRRNKR